MKILTALERVAVWHPYRLAQSDVHFDWQHDPSSAGWELTVRDPSGAWKAVVTAPRGQSMFYAGTRTP
jgi:hypothetical protein